MAYPINTLSQLRPVLKGFRKASGMTQAAVASHLGVTQQTYAQLEANPAAVSVERLFKVLRVLGVSFLLAPVGTEAGQDVIVAPLASAEATQRPAKNGRPRKKVGTAATGPAPAGASASANQKARTRAGTSGARPAAATRRAPAPVIKKRENW